MKPNPKLANKYQRVEDLYGGYPSVEAGEYESLKGVRFLSEYRDDLPVYLVLEAGQFLVCHWPFGERRIFLAWVTDEEAEEMLDEQEEQYYEAIRDKVELQYS